MSHITKRTQAIADAADKLSRAFREADWEAIEDHIGGPRADAIRSMVDALAMPTEGMRLVVEQDYECEGHAVATVIVDFNDPNPIRAKDRDELRVGHVKLDRWDVGQKLRIAVSINSKPELRPVEPT